MYSALILSVAPSLIRALISAGLEDGIPTQGNRSVRARGWASDDADEAAVSVVAEELEGMEEAEVEAEDEDDSDNEEKEDATAELEVGVFFELGLCSADNICGDSGAAAAIRSPALLHCALP